MTASLRVKNDKYYVVLTHTTDGKKNQTWVSTGLSVTGNEGKARQIMLDMLGENLSRLPRPICFSVTPCAAGWRMSGIVWTRSPTKATRFRPERTSSLLR